MKPTHCDFCGLQGEMIFVHSHYQCPRCGINVAPCCQGESCEWEGEQQAPETGEADTAGSQT
ncbi:MAG: hypothetical protein ACK5CL_03240 [Sphingomonadales bacterium]